MYPETIKTTLGPTSMKDNGRLRSETRSTPSYVVEVRGSRSTSDTPSKVSVRVPDGGWGWVVVGASFVIQLLTIGSTYTFGVVYVDLLKVFKESESTTAWIGSIQTALLYLSGLIGGPMVQSFGCRAVGLLGSLLSCAGFVVSAFAPNVYVLYTTYGVMTGIGNGLMYVTATIAVQQYFDRRRSMATGIAVAGSGIGTLTFGLLTRFLLDRLQWRWTLIILGCIMLLGVACTATYRSLDSKSVDDERRPLLSSSADDVSEVSVRQRRSLSNLFACRTFVTSLLDFSLFRSPPFVLFCIMTVCFSFGYHVPYAYTPDRAQTMYGIDGRKAAALVSMMGVANVVSRPLFGFAVDRSVLMRFYCMAAVTIGCGLTSCMAFLMTSYGLMVVYSVLFGAFGGCWASVLSVVIVDMMGVDDLEKSIGLNMATSSIGFLVAAPLSGVIIKATGGNYNMPFTVVGSVQVVGGLLMLFARCFPWPSDVLRAAEDERRASAPEVGVAYVNGDCPSAAAATSDLQLRLSLSSSDCRTPVTTAVHDAIKSENLMT